MKAAWSFLLWGALSLGNFPLFYVFLDTEPQHPASNVTAVLGIYHTRQQAIVWGVFPEREEK